MSRAYESSRFLRSSESGLLTKCFWGRDPPNPLPEALLLKPLGTYDGPRSLSTASPNPVAGAAPACMRRKENYCDVTRLLRESTSDGELLLDSLSLHYFQPNPTTKMDRTTGPWWTVTLSPTDRLFNLLYKKPCNVFMNGTTIFELVRKFVNGLVIRKQVSQQDRPSVARP